MYYYRDTKRPYKVRTMYYNILYYSSPVYAHAVITNIVPTMVRRREDAGQLMRLNLRRKNNTCGFAPTYCVTFYLFLYFFFFDKFPKFLPICLCRRRGGANIIIHLIIICMHIIDDRTYRDTVIILEDTKKGQPNTNVQRI